jgi:hypothetical protein
VVGGYSSATSLDQIFDQFYCRIFCHSPMAGGRSSQVSELSILSEAGVGRSETTAFSPFFISLHYLRR